MTIGALVDTRIPKLGTPVAEVLARPGVTVVYTTVDAVQAAGLNVSQGNQLPPAWQGDTTTGRMAPDIPGGLHFEKVLLVATGAPLPLSARQKQQE